MIHTIFPKLKTAIMSKKPSWAYSTSQVDTNCAMRIPTCNRLMIGLMALSIGMVMLFRAVSLQLQY